MTPVGHQRLSRAQEAFANQLLDELCAIQGVEKAIVTSCQGFPLFSCPPLETRSDLKEALFTAAMIVGLMAAVAKSSEQLGRQVCELLTIHCVDDYIVVCGAIHGVALAVSATKNCRLGFLHHIVRQYEKKLGSLLNDGS
ncbi:MAG: roadblock/LC7 domain-containing protein [Candidatus Thorarchaeota archaeon]